MFFPLSPIFPSFPSKEFFFGKRSVLIGFSYFPNLWVNWMVLATAHFGFFLGVQDISNTPKIISPLGKSHKMVFNLALCYSGFSPFMVFPFSPIFPLFPFKEFFLGSIRF